MTRNLKSLEENVEIENRMGLDSCLLDPDETRSLVSTLSKDYPIVAGKYCPSDGSANPLLVCKAIARKIRRMGGSIHEHEPLEKWAIHSDRITAAITLEGEYQAPVFVNATGAWAKGLCNTIGLDFPLKIKRSQLLVTEALPQMIKEFISDSGVGYMRQSLNGGIHLGIPSAPVKDFDKTTTLDAFIKAGKGYTKIFPFLKDTHIIHSWAGLTDWTPDSIPILDKAPSIEGMFLCSGFSGHGFCLGPGVGKLMAEWIVDGKPSIDLHGFRWERFKGYVDEEKEAAWI